MADLIDRQAFLKKMMKTNRYFAVKFDIEEEPSVDAVEVVRCKDCKHCIDAHGDGFMYCMRTIEAPDYSETGYLYPLEVRVGFYGFCSYGERREENAAD